MRRNVRRDGSLASPIVFLESIQIPQTFLYDPGIPRVRRDTMPGVLAQAMAQREHATVYHVRSPCDLEAVLRDARRYVGG